MSFMTTDTKKLREMWMKLYLNLCGLKSRHPKAKEILDVFQMSLYEFNEKVMKFFDDLEAPAYG